MKVSFYKSAKDVSPYQSKDVGIFLDRIRTGKSEKLVKEIRFQTTKEEKNKLKIQLPGVTFAGEFIKRNNNSLKKSSGLMIIDIDEVEDVISLKEDIIKNKHVYSAWISPSGNGLKLLVKIPMVETDQDYKRIFKQVRELFSDVDESGKDISRFCFESYDPNIYINLEAETFIPEIEETPLDVNNLGTVTNLPLLDTDEIANRLIKWFKGKYNPSNRNSSLFKLAISFNDFGVSKDTCQRYLLGFEQKDFTQNEINALINSAYKNSANFGNKQFEDKEKKSKLNNLILAGKDNKAIFDEFTEFDKAKLEQEITIQKSVIKIDEFWQYDKEGQLKIMPYRFKLFVEHLNYYKYYPIQNTKTFVFITKRENFINNVSEFQIKDKIMHHLINDNKIEVFDVIAEKTKIFTPQFLSMIDTADVSIEKDGTDYAMIYFKNYAVKVSQSDYEVFDYSELKGYVWEDQVIDRDFIDADHHESMFRSFVWFISGEEVDRYNTMKSIIGYMLHSHKTSSNNKAIILNDETVSDNPNGGSGKGILINAISHMKKVSTIDGKTFDFNKSFPYQTVSTDCQVLAFDDVRKNFDFERLFSIITEGITIEYKGKDAIKIPVKDSPKIIISTNYTIKAEGGSFARRMFEVELSAYFGIHKTPFDVFGCMLFDDWSPEEWARFDHYMINCLQFYLENGLVQSTPKNLELRKFINETCQEYYEFVTENNIPCGIRHFKNELYDKFIEENSDMKKWLTKRIFNKWCMKYANFKKFDYNESVTNGKRWFTLGGEEVKEEENNLPF